jgi:hypothetical protein
MWNFLDFWKSMVGIGYDFAQPLWGIGIQEGALLVATDHLVITELVVLPALAPPYDEAMINASFSIDSDTTLEAEVTWTVARVGREDPWEDEGATDDRRDLHSSPASLVVRSTVSLKPGHNRVHSPEALKVLKPDLWWPRGFGSQPMYTLAVSVSGKENSSNAMVAMDSASRRFGIRDLKHVRNPGPESWTYIEEFYCGPGGHTGAAGWNCKPTHELHPISPESPSYFVRYLSTGTHEPDGERDSGEL